jgi:radical SAM protein with 4Fe4S-binding SPASM domain
MFLNEELLRIVEVKRNSVVNRFANLCNAYYIKVQEKLMPTRRLLIVGIMVTEKCNLNCIYCYEKYKTNKTISISKAKEIISYVLTADSIWTDIEFRLLGGEPFMVSHLIYDIIEWTFDKKWNKRCRFKITTNGTLLDREMKDWLRKYKDRVCLVLSLDGPAHVHDKNRNGSYSNIDFKFFFDTWPKQSVKMTISKESMSELFNSLVYIQNNLGLNVSFSLAGGQEWSEMDLRVFDNEQRKLLILYSQNKQYLPPIYNINFTRIFRPNDTTRQCGIGRNVVAYDTDGNSFPCHILLPNVNGKQKIPRFSEFSDDNFLKDNYCDECIIRNICPTCYAFNFIERGSCNERDHNFCTFYKMIAKYSAIIKMIRYSKQTILNRKDLEEIDAILYLNKFLSEDKIEDYAEITKQHLIR